MVSITVTVTDRIGIGQDGMDRTTSIDQVMGQVISVSHHLCVLSNRTQGKKNNKVSR